MAAKSSKRKDLEVHLGSSGQVVGRLHLGSGKRSAFSYDERWLQDATMLQSDGHDMTHACTELVDVLLQEGASPIADIHELWRRL